MMSLFEAAWVIARRDFIASVFSRTFILFLIAPMILFAFAAFFAIRDRFAGARGASADRRRGGRQRHHRCARPVAHPARRRHVRAKLSDPARGRRRPSISRPRRGHCSPTRAAAIPRCLGGTLDHPVLTGPTKTDGYVASRLQLLIDDARRTAALRGANAAPPPAPIERVVTEQAAGNLQMIRRGIARAGQSIIFTATMLLATLLLSTLVEEKTNKVIEVLAAAVPLDAIFFGKLLAMLGISLVGLTLWAAMAGLGYTFFIQVFRDWVTLPDVAPAVGWPIWILLVLLYFTTNFLLLGALFLGIGAQASNIREIQTISMPVTMLQLLVFFLVITVAAPTLGALALTVDIVPFTSPHGDDRIRRGIRDALAAPARARLAGALGGHHHSHLVAAVPPDGVPIRVGRFLLLVRAREGEERSLSREMLRPAPAPFCCQSSILMPSQSRIQAKLP